MKHLPLNKQEHDGSQSFYFRKTNLSTANDSLRMTVGQTQPRNLFFPPPVRCRLSHLNASSRDHYRIKFLKLFLRKAFSSVDPSLQVKLPAVRCISIRVSVTGLMHSAKLPRKTMSLSECFVSCLYNSRFFGCHLMRQGSPASGLSKGDSHVPANSGNFTAYFALYFILRLCYKFNP